MTTELWLSALSILLTALSGVVWKLWTNHQTHAEKTTRALWKEIDALKAALRESNAALQTRFDASCNRVEGSINALYDISRKQGERIAAVESICRARHDRD